MRSGCDPDDLEAASRRCGVLTERLHGARRHVEQLRHARWSGAVAARRRTELAELSPRLGRAAVTVEHLARRLSAQATQQRRASLGAPSTAVLRASHAGDGRWVARTGSSGAPVVVVLVPGVGTTVGDRHELDAAARRVWEQLAVRAERSGAGEDSVAVVGWLGYDPPDHVLGGLARAPAERGGRQLAADVATWRRGGASRIVVAGHSYGAVVAARASAAGMGADEVVMLGAPGLGVADRPALRLAPGADVWAAAAPADVISLLARTGSVHGPDPLTLARRLPTSGSGHSSYLRDAVLLDALAGLALHDPRPAGTVAAPAT